MADSQTCNHPKEFQFITTVGERRFYDYEIYDDSECVTLCGICYQEIVPDQQNSEYEEREF